VPNVLEIWERIRPGTLWATPGLLRDSFTFTFYRMYFERYGEQRLRLNIDRTTCILFPAGHLHPLLDSGSAALLHETDQFLCSFILEDKTLIIIHCNFELQFLELKFFPIHAVKTWRMELKIHLFLTSGREVGHCSASHPVALPLRREAPINLGEEQNVLLQVAMK